MFCPPSVRFRSAGVLSLTLVATGLALMGQPTVLRAQGASGGAVPVTRQFSAAMAEQAAVQAAERILTAVRNRDAQAYYALLAPDPQRVSSPSLAARALQRLPRLLSWRLGEIVPGVDSSSVNVEVQTSEGPRVVLLVIDSQGRLEGYHVNATDAKAEDVVRSFMQAITQGYFVTASSYLGERLREEIPQSVLQRKWLNLQAITGQYKAIKKIVRAESNDQMKLVIVTTQFSRLTDNLYVILDSSNQIIGVDFPDSPLPPRAVMP